MTKISKKYVGVVLLSVLVFTILIAVISIIIVNAKYVYLEGTVTEYDMTPTMLDGSIVFRIDNQRVGIGGGLRDASLDGKVDSLIVGDSVKAKLVRSESGSLSIYKCPECYVKKIE